VGERHLVVADKPRSTAQPLVLRFGQLQDRYAETRCAGLGLS
jgi:hypothetical protein